MEYFITFTFKDLAHNTDFHASKTAADLGI